MPLEQVLHLESAGQLHSGQRGLCRLPEHRLMGYRRSDSLPFHLKTLSQTECCHIPVPLQAPEPEQIAARPQPFQLADKRSVPEIEQPAAGLRFRFLLKHPIDQMLFRRHQVRRTVRRTRQ